ncbi:hypothetical protein THAOC_14555 [Thalassiosira oceanica]|uniref:Uncharacterized protein n=1 Tax=Thalassiosira oceanica TaxID=159749 RepID=K0SHC3_THAOC|nr:hypothetical protein THAOC_14555 [Thalassiosira oceanica]|eukprot:EJK64685.1 hypothetical protein THAOC_14555 [Thalassiosira oceanica]
MNWNLMMRFADLAPIVTSAVEEGLAVEAGPEPRKRARKVNLSFGFGNVILSLWKQGLGRGKGLVGQPADHIIHHQAGGREKCSRFNFLCSRPPTLRRQQQQQQQQQQERINAGPEVSTFPDAGPELLKTCPWQLGHDYGKVSVYVSVAA